MPGCPKTIGINMWSSAATVECDNMIHQSVRIWHVGNSSGRSQSHEDIPNDKHVVVGELGLFATASLR